MKVSRTVWVKGKSRDYFKGLPIDILLATEDDYITGFTKFDFMSKIPSEIKTMDEYVRIAQKSVIKWTTEDIAKIETHLETLRDEVVALDLNIELPETIYLIQSTCEEEGGAAGYTRQNFIVLNKDAIDMHLIAHEFFHIISRYNPEKAEKIYKTIGFTPTDTLDLPPVLADNIITNPDATDLSYKIRVTHNSNSKDGILLMFSPHKYTGGSFFDYINIGLYFPDKTSEFKLSDMVYIDEVSDFLEQIGWNTKYIIHPEEISAEHFRILITDPNGNFPNLEHVEALEKILKE